MPPATCTLAAWLHDLDPAAVSLGPFTVHWYGLSYLLSFALAWIAFQLMARRGILRLSPTQATDALITMIVGVIVGGRLGYVLVYQPALLVQFDSAFPFWGVLAIHQGGMASHGGIVGVVAACALVARRTRREAAAEDQAAADATPGTLHILDAAAAVTPIGLGLGRLANFVNGELLGKIVAGPGEPAPWWAVRYPQELKHRFDELEPRLSPVQRLDLAGLIDQAGSVDALLARVHAGDPTITQRLAGLITARHPSQLYQAFAEGLVVLAVVWAVWTKPRKPGVIAGWFGVSYGVGRVITEFYRLPDAHLAAPRIAGLSRGQWLSLAVIAVGVTLIVWASRRAGPKLGGWLGGTRTRPTSS